MKTLAIETSCDDTSLALVTYKNWFFDIEKCLLHSQIDNHRKYGWVVPELASRLHEEKIVDLINEIWIEEIKKVDFISYTCCPGLPWSLLVGKTAANTLSLFLKKEKVWINHIHGHIFSILAERNIQDIQFPLLVLTVSWGHNDIYLITKNDVEWLKNDTIWWKSNHTKSLNNPKILNQYLNDYSENYNIPKEELISQIWEFTIYKIGMTLDDAAGEAFDKVSKMLWWPYPWWKWIYDVAQIKNEKLKMNNKNDIEWFNNDIKWWNHRESSNNYIKSLNQSPKSPQNLQISTNLQISFPRIYLKKNEFNFSFSGLKAQVNYKIQELKEKYWENLPEEIISLIAYEFQQATIETLSRKIFKAAEHFWIENIALVGWVSANQALKEIIIENKEKYWIKNFYTPVKNLYSTDNAAMIWVVGILWR